MKGSINIGHHTEMMTLLFLNLITAYRREALAGRHPVFRKSFAKAAKTWNVKLESEQIRETLELVPREFVRFDDLLKGNDITWT
jgi:hypothetical protein